MEAMAASSSFRSDPPLHQTYKTLLEKSQQPHSLVDKCSPVATGAGETELPVIDLGPLVEGGDAVKVAECRKEIAKASAEWGFFQVVNHGISSLILERMRMEQEEMFSRPFEEKKTCMGVAGGSYRWGAPRATCLDQLSWTEAFHIPMSHLVSPESSSRHQFRSMEEYARKVTDLATKLINALAGELGRDTAFFDQNCNPSTCILRLNKYPPCPMTPGIYGLMPHTDSDFLTILCQDEVGGLQVMKDRTWLSVRPNPQSLIVNVGDLFQAWSNDVYRSVEHRVVTNRLVERYSVAYFVCPLVESVIESEDKQHDQVYRRFSFGEYRAQVDEDVLKNGYKVGPTRFLASRNFK